MDKYLEAEKRLAELLGVQNIHPHFKEAVWCGNFPGKPTQQLPQWCRDDAAAFALMVGHLAMPSFYKEEVMVDFPRAEITVHTEFANHPDKETAVRYAIVQAVIKKLEAGR